MALLEEEVARLRGGESGADEFVAGDGGISVGGFSSGGQAAGVVAVEEAFVAPDSDAAGEGCSAGSGLGCR